MLTEKDPRTVASCIAWTTLVLNDRVTAEKVAEYVTAFKYS